jgi:sulfite reductase (NADPH) flavoprotein alpha-component
MTAPAAPYSPRNPFPARHLSNTRLSGEGSSKDTRHHAISLEGSGMTYLPGDALGVHPVNDPALVDLILARIGASGDETLPDKAGQPSTLRHLLLHEYDITSPSRRLLEACGERGAAAFASMLEKGHEEALKAYFHAHDASHDVLDVLEEAPGCAFTPEALVGALRKMIPRLYSIASSFKKHPGEAHLTVVAVTYTVRGRVRRGICSTFINERWPVGATAGVYTQNQQKHFAMPADPATPMIMVGPGTGVAPFRAFLEEREALGATGRNWLFFGEQRRATEFFYEDEFTRWSADGRLRLDTAFSRDQAQKVYVQHRMREQSRDIYAWLEDGAEFFVCGDKERMAADVEAELHAIVEREGGRTPEQAKEYVEAMRKSKRYKRDVY